mmetsp:Transcript_5502/g.13784  ORF Transcript_5502/g.13784 Transcript_5502/m.13784 type:complete len:1381 (-) Transcript_5502:188-4330(-)
MNSKRSHNHNLQKPPLSNRPNSNTMAIRSKIRNNTSNFIGGTIAVPDTSSAMDPMDMSCRSDLTMDLAPEDGTSSARVLSSMHGHPHHYREYLRTNSSEQQQRDPLTPPLLNAPRLKRDASGNSFYTATNNVKGPSDDLREPSNAGDEVEEENMDDIDFPALDDEDDDASEMRELDELAENAAVSAFGADAGKVDGPMRRSTLVSENATIDVSWFAARGLMSRRSFERYQKEMKSKVITSASNNNLRSMNHRGSRRASISMGDLRNESWEAKPQTEKKSKASSSRPKALSKSMRRPSPQQISTKAFSRPRSLDSLNEFGGSPASAPDEGLDKLVKSFIVAFKSDDDAQGHSDRGKATTLIKSKLMHSTAPKSIIKSDTDEVPEKNAAENGAPSGLNSDEIQVLTKMLGRLSQEQDVSPFQNEDDEGKGDEDRSIQDELLSSKVTKRDCSSDNLMDSSTWETPVHKIDDVIGAEASCFEERARPNMAKRSSSNRSLKTLKTGNESNLGRLANKYRPQRSSSAELKNLRVRDVESSNWEDSFATAQDEGNGRLSSRNMSAPKRDSISSLLSQVPNERNKSEGSDILADRLDSMSTLGCDTPGEWSHTVSALGFDSPGPPSPQTKTFEHSDTMSTQSPQAQGREDNYLHISTSSMLAQPQLDHEFSAVSVTSQGAVATEEFIRQDSISTQYTMPLKRDGGVPRPLQKQPTRADAAPSGRTTPSSIHDELDRFEESDGNHNSFGANRFPSAKNSRPPRRHSMSSEHSSSGSSLMMRRGSFSSIFTTPADLDELEGPPAKEGCGDVLQEGMDYLSMAMLVNVYAKLRELSMLGHASVKLQDIDVNSHQSLARKKELKRLGLSKTEDEPYLESTKTAGAVVRTVLDEYEMFEASSELSTVFHTKANMTYDASLLSEFKTWVEESKVKQLDSVTEQVIRTLREECSRRQNLIKVRSSNESLSSMGQVRVRNSIARRRGSLIEKSNSFLDASWLKQEMTLIADHFGIKNGSVPENNKDDAIKESRRISNGMLTESMIERTFDKSHCYFEEGSSLRNLLESGLEVVWFSDRHPDDIIYCICVNRETLTVTLVFRGQEGFTDLIKDSAMSQYSNPIGHADYEGNSEFINLRSAVSDEIMRVRRDTKKSTLYEISRKVDEIGRELADGGKYHLSVTGHSLGGGLATVAGFYLASDDSLELASALRVFTFSSSRVGCMAFHQGFKHLEETGRLQHARFTNSSDIISSLPMLDSYHHVGMQICLHKANNAGRQRIRQSLDVRYNKNGSRLKESYHFVMDIFSAMQVSRISEYQHRMHFAREYRLALGDGVLRFDKKRNRLKTLNNYYLMKCRLSDFMGLAKEKTWMPSFLVFFFVSCLISFEIALLFKFVATW